MVPLKAVLEDLSDSSGTAKDMAADFDRLVALMAEKTAMTPAQVQEHFLLTFCSALKNPVTRSAIIKIFGSLWIDCIGDLTEQRKKARERDQKRRERQAKKKDESLAELPKATKLPEDVLALLERDDRGHYVGVFPHGDGFRARVKDPAARTQHLRWLATAPSAAEAALTRMHWYRGHAMPYTTWEKYIEKTKNGIYGDPQNVALHQKYGEGFLLYLAWTLGREDGVVGCPETEPEEAKVVRLLLEQVDRPRVKHISLLQHQGVRPQPDSESEDNHE